MWQLSCSIVFIHPVRTFWLIFFPYFVLQLEGRSSSAFVSCCLICPFAYEFQLLLHYCLVKYCFVSSSIKKSLTVEKAHGAWESSDDSRNKLMRVASTSKLISKVAKNADKYVLVCYIKQENLRVKILWNHTILVSLLVYMLRTFLHLWFYCEYLHNLPIWCSRWAWNFKIIVK